MTKVSLTELMLAADKLHMLYGDVDVIIEIDDDKTHLVLQKPEGGLVGYSLNNSMEGK